MTQKTVIESQEADQEHLLIIGDLIIDRTIYVTVPKISPESPVPVAMVEPDMAVETPGGAGLAAAFASKNSIRSIFLTTTSDDRIDWLSKFNIATYRAIESLNVRKTRYIDIKSNYHLLRVDTDKAIKLPNPGANLIKSVNELLYKYNISCVLFLDYCKGIFTSVNLVKDLISVIKERSIPIYVDTRSKDILKFSGVDILKLNNNELSSLFMSDQYNSINNIISSLIINELVITKGENGADIYSLDEKVSYSPDLSKYTGIPDVTGCGDVFDVSFCYNRYIKKRDLMKSVSNAVDIATDFAYKSIKERLC
jgi:D-beta-D-heptose 7-phosphate kinase / D-beta-D-heptose 1-phosphate adenosyltransferase